MVRESSIWEKAEGGMPFRASSRMFYRAISILRQKFNSRDTSEIRPMAGDIKNSSGRSLHFTCNTSEQGK
jgi:hypothetical protein